MNIHTAGHEFEKETLLQQKAVSLSPDILSIIEATREGAMEELDAVGTYPELVLEFEPSPNHVTARAIEYFKKYFADKSEEDMELLNGMKIIAEDELELMNGIVVKLGYPKIKEKSHEVYIINATGNNDECDDFEDSVLFRYGEELKKYRAKMTRQGFKIAGDSRDYKGERALEEMEKIFSMFPGKGTDMHPYVILDILGRSFSGFIDNFRRGGGHRGLDELELFWTISPTEKGADVKNYLELKKGRARLELGSANHVDGLTALFYKDRYGPIRLADLGKELQKANRKIKRLNKAFGFTKEFKNKA